MKNALGFSMLLFIASAANADVTRHALPNDNPFPIARAVEVSSQTTLIFHSGQVPGPANPNAERGSREYYGDTEAQAMSVFRRFEASFAELDVGFGDVVKMTVFLVGDPIMDGKMDFQGFMRAYTRYFGTEAQPNKPARSAVQIAGLAGGPNMLVEVEMVIARPPFAATVGESEVLHREGTSFGGEPLMRRALADTAKAVQIEAAITGLEDQADRGEQDYITLGQQYAAAGRYRGAIDAYGRGIEAYPNSFKLLRHRAHRYISVRELENAKHDLDRALALVDVADPATPEYRLSGEQNETYLHWIWYHIGLYHYLNGDYSQAAEAYQHCVDTAIGSSALIGATDWQYNAYQKAGNSAAAAAALERVSADIDADQSHVYFKRVMLYKGELEPSDILDATKAADWSGADATIAYGVASWYRYQGNDAAAQILLEQILATPFWNAWAYVVSDKELADQSSR